MKALSFLALLVAIVTAFGCSGKKEAAEEKDWHPREASVARHITDVHGFVIDDSENAHLKVDVVVEAPVSSATGDATNAEAKPKKAKKRKPKIVAQFREDVLEELGGERALYVFLWEQNPQEMKKAEYLYFLEALHAYLVLNAPKWDGGEGKEK